MLLFPPLKDYVSYNLEYESLLTRFFEVHEGPLYKLKRSFKFKDFFTSLTRNARYQTCVRVSM